MEEPRIAIISNGWAMCPWCRKKGARVHDGAHAKMIGLHCRKCGRDYLLDF